MNDEVATMVITWATSSAVPMRPRETRFFHASSCVSVKSAHMRARLIQSESSNQSYGCGGSAGDPVLGSYAVSSGLRSSQDTRDWLVCCDPRPPSRGSWSCLGMPLPSLRSLSGDGALASLVLHRVDVAASRTDESRLGSTVGHLTSIPNQSNHASHIHDRSWIVVVISISNWVHHDDAALQSRDRCSWTFALLEHEQRDRGLARVHARVAVACHDARKTLGTRSKERARVLDARRVHQDMQRLAKQRLERSMHSIGISHVALERTMSSCCQACLIHLIDHWLKPVSAATNR